jgi:hypothetical protein
LTTVPPTYVLAEHSGGAYVKLPPCGGSLTTVSLYAPQAHIVLGVDKDIAIAANATIMATTQNRLSSLLNFKPLLTSINQDFPLLS